MKGSISVSSPFISENFLLESSKARMLYFTYAAEVPIIDYHNHLCPKILAENRPFENLYEAWLSEDHYKWRAMRAHGVDEQFITGNASDERKFLKWSSTVPYTVGNPLFHWTHLELNRYFEIEEFLQPKTALEIYQKANSILKKTSPRSLLHKMNVECICTTDDPADTLEYHEKLTTENFSIKVLPTFRSDSLFLIEENGFLPYLENLASLVGFSITNLDDLLQAISIRIDFFQERGCCISDYGLEGKVQIVVFSKLEIAEIVKKRLTKRGLSTIEIQKYKTFMLMYLGRKYHEKDWVQQYHLGALRNVNKRLLHDLGPNVGGDSISGDDFSDFLASFLGGLDAQNALAKTVVYNLNPSQNEVFATMMGNFGTGGIPGKMQWGPSWWYLDQKKGIENHIETLASVGLLGHFVGMLTDSRSFLSFPRHEYFRRILCNFIGNKVLTGELPDDEMFLGEIIRDISYGNAKKYFNVG